MLYIIYVLILNDFKMSHCKIINVVNIIYTIFVQREIPFIILFICVNRSLINNVEENCFTLTRICLSSNLWDICKLYSLRFDAASGAVLYAEKHFIEN